MFLLNLSSFFCYLGKTFPDPDNLLNGNAMTASSRTTAFNIVTDMLRKLNVSSFFSCFNLSKRNGVGFFCFIFFIEIYLKIQILV